MSNLFALKVFTDQKRLAFICSNKEKAIVVAHSEITKALQSFAAGGTKELSISFEMFSEDQIECDFLQLPSSGKIVNSCIQSDPS